MLLHGGVMNKSKWHEMSSNFLKSELVKQGVDYKLLEAKLKGIGIEETYNSIANKINRGSFSFAFFMQCMKALDIKDIRL